MSVQQLSALIMSAPTPRATSRDLRREDTRRRIYQSAMDIFRRDGFSVARIDDIAAAAGVSHGAFYFHFATKEEVLFECLRASEVRVAAALSELGPETHLEAALSAAWSAVGREWQDDTRLFPDVAMVALRYFALGGGGAARHPTSAVSVALTPFLRTASERGELNPFFPAAMLSDLFLLNVFAAMLSWSSDASLPLPVMLAGVTRIFLDGVRGGAPGREPPKV
jgi:AcrR family transcriptional regulator